MSFSQMAQDFVEATSTLVGGRTINIMDTNAVIIASTARERVGNFHQGAVEVIATRQMVMIHEQDVKDYPGAREGCNMPIITDGKMVGVVGVFGKPEVVIEIANLLRVYVSQYFQQKFHMRRQRMETEVRTQLLDLLLTGKDEDRSQIMQLCNVIQVVLQFPLQVVLFQAGDGLQTQNLNHVEELYQKLAASTDQSNINAMLETARIYYEEGGSVAKAAERLHLHKNTLLYRMNRLFGILGMEEEKAFIREFFVRLILEMY